LQSVFANPGKDWEEKKIKEIGKTQTGLTPKTANKKYYGNFVPFITPADVDILGDGSIRYNSKGLSEEGLEVGRKIEKNSVLMVCIGATIGKVGFATEIVSCNQQINTLTPEIKYDAKLFYYILSTKSFFNKVIEGSSQATLPIINKGKWENLIVTFPKSLIEQKSIVAKLDALLVETKKLETIYKQKMADLEELKKSVLKRAFNGDL
jgi:type I restriction enzyme S subunit